MLALSKQGLQGPVNPIALMNPTWVCETANVESALQRNSRRAKFADQRCDGRAAKRNCGLSTQLRRSKTKAFQKNTWRGLTIGDPAATGLAVPALLKSTMLPRFPVLAVAGPLLTGDGDRFAMRLTDL